MVYLFQHFELREKDFCLYENGKRIPLEPKALRVLLLLLSRAGHLVEKDFLLQTVWSDTFVEENTLTRTILVLRRVLGDDRRNQIFIETVPTRGYRFVAEVRQVPEEDELPQVPGPPASEGDPPETKPPLPAKPSAPKALYYVAATTLVLVLIAATLLLRHPSPATVPDSKDWQQLTFFTDSAVYPALSPDGRMLAFIRADNPFLAHGEVYVKLLPAGEPVQLTHDSTTKIGMSFSPDNSTIAYGVAPSWDTWEVPVLGGEPHILLPNASSLRWIDGGKHLLFSEIKEGLHMAVVTTDPDRGNSRDVYVPTGIRSMAHHSYLSPDGRSVLIVQMGSQGEIQPCRIVPFQGPAVQKLDDSRMVGPPTGACISAAWTPDGKWIYLAVRTDDFHIWRQRFPDGTPEQLTFGPTSQEGIAMAPDGKSLITSVGSRGNTVWLHDKDGDHQISSEGSASSPKFSADGQSLYYIMTNGQMHAEDLWVKDLKSGKQEKVLQNYPMEDYSVSQDGKLIAFSMKDHSGHTNLWIAQTSRRSPPVRIVSAAVEDSPLFLPDGDLIFRAIEGNLNFLYRMKADGTGRRKITAERILDTFAVSPDGRWAVASTPNSNEDHPVATKAFAVNGGPPVPLCVDDCKLVWDTDGKGVFLSFILGNSSRVIPVAAALGLPVLPPGLGRGAPIIAKTDAAIPWHVESAVNPTVYAYAREDTRHNLYRIQLP